MNRVSAIMIFIMFVFLPACYSKRQNQGIFYTSDTVHSKKDKDIMASKEILLTSLFVATNHVPEEIKTSIEFFEHGKSSLSKDAKNKLAEFTQEVLSYEDYTITVEGHEDAAEAGSDQNYKKLSEKRAENVKKALIRSGLDKDKIESMGVGISKPAAKENTEDGRRQNRRVIIEAELW